MQCVKWTLEILDAFTDAFTCKHVSREKNEGVDLKLFEVPPNFISGFLLADMPAAGFGPSASFLFRPLARIFIDKKKRTFGNWQMSLPPR